MMDAARIDDLIQRGRGIAASRVGEWHTLHRPTRAASPLGGASAIMRMQAVFTPSTRLAAYGHPVYEAAFDAAYTRPGDYLVSPDITWFIAGQQPLQPLLCVKTTRVIDVLRPARHATTGLAGYGGLRRDEAAIVLSGWPASAVIHGFGLDRVDLPGDARLGGWSVLLPALPGVDLRTGDLITDDLGRAAVVSSAELSDLGWRLLARQAAS